jgi:hypothetical protein
VRPVHCCNSVGLILHAGLPSGVNYDKMILQELTTDYD